jgi:hypothetical protein
MAKLIHYVSGPEPLDPDLQPASLPPNKVEITVTPEPKTRKQRQGNAKAKAFDTAMKRQEANAHPQRRQSESQRTALRKLRRDLYHYAVRKDLAAGKITVEQANELLTKRRKPDRTDSNI